MTGIVACALVMPRLAEAARARGLRLVPMTADRPHPRARVAVMGCDDDPRARLTQVRATGWRRPLLLVLPRGGCVTRALDAGADDAVARPVSAEEIAARIAARLRAGAEPGAPLQIGDLAIDTVERRVTRGGRAVPLLPREYQLLLYLARNAGRCVGRDELLEAVWGLRFDPGTNVVTVHVSRLRARIDRGFPVPLIETEKGRGYRLSPDQGISWTSAT
ncbi:winged helix-turn-helix domain-containing protein [Sphingomonas canadensis]|uniref:Winged helix-turn-helix domain-containing protein n=1 Tax=Sphingomonas canadensis TaxID=1219257 RepID=A0ABW3H469_9SPHN|nr:winged helix-turn-helix domain-containing protein [Sphingomonas canadensis]MCW3834970.1 winged helix-turn-helix domain-containing protein [Sphingomonas canadensis]